MRAAIQVIVEMRAQMIQIQRERNRDMIFLTLISMVKIWLRSALFTLPIMRFVLAIILNRLA